MTISKKIEQWLETVETGIIFKYDVLPIEKDDFFAAAKVMERLIRKQKINRVSKGLFYKPENTPFGELKPSEDELLKLYLFKNGKRIAYITGNFLYNKMGLTTQISSSIKIASRDTDIYITLGTVKAKPIKSYVDVTDDNYKLLEILDSLKDWNKIQDMDNSAGIDIISNLLKSLSDEKQRDLIIYALSYPPRVKAFLGALLENINSSLDMSSLKTSLNPLSKYKYKIKSIPSKIQNNWNLI